MAGTLFIVSSPIGNLGDMSPRGREVLAAVDVIACEDTRVAGKLLRHLGVDTKRVSYHEHNEAERAEELLSRLREGTDVALLTDAGTPLVSDPGFRLVRAAREAGLEVRALPGPSAVLAALAVSGLPPTPFTFLGFLPPKGEARRRAVETIASSPHTLVLFEAPTRVARLLADLAAVERLGARQAALAREMTKLHEEHWIGSLARLAERAKGGNFKGEITLVVQGSGGERPPMALESLGGAFAQLREEGLTARAAARALAKLSGLPARDIYRAFAADADAEEIAR